MPEAASASSSATLVARLKAREPAAWQRMVQVYGPEVYRWARHTGLQDCDAADVVQEVFRGLASGLDAFDRDRPGASFRGWLHGVAWHKIQDHFRSRGKVVPAAGGSTAQARLQQFPHPESSADTDEENSSRQRVIRRLMEALTTEFEPRTWQACWRTVVEGQSTANVARDLQMTDKAVRQARYRVLNRLRIELEGLLD